MSTTKKDAPARPIDFEPIASYECLLKLREELPDVFLLQTSQAARYALSYYERLKVQAVEMKEEAVS